MGLGSARCGGAPSCDLGHRCFFGCTEEKARFDIFGCAARGTPADPPLDHSTGVGRVDAAAGYYDDARGKGHNVVHLHTEALGGHAGGALSLLRRLDGRAKAKGHRDGTVYGSSSSATRGFFSHHLRLTSLAAFTNVGFAIVRHRDCLASHLTDPASVIDPIPMAARAAG